MIRNNMYTLLEPLSLCSGFSIFKSMSPNNTMLEIDNVQRTFGGHTYMHTAILDAQCRHLFSQFDMSLYCFSKLNANVPP